jgi:hypothetical protein
MAPEGVAAMLTLTGRFGFTVIVIALDVAGLPVTQARLDVILTLMTSPLARSDAE